VGEMKQTEKGKERAKDRGLEKQEDEVLLDTGRYSPYEDLSEYEMEMEYHQKQATSPQVEQPVGRPQPTKYKRTKEADPEYIDTRASVVHARNSLPKTHGRHNTGYKDRYEGHYGSTLARGGREERREDHQLGGHLPQQGHHISCIGIPNPGKGLGGLASSFNI